MKYLIALVSLSLFLFGGYCGIYIGRLIGSHSEQQAAINANVAQYNPKTAEFEYSPSSGILIDDGTVERMAREQTIIDHPLPQRKPKK